MDTINKQEVSISKKVCKFFLGSLPGKVDENQLELYFSGFGEVLNLEVVKNLKTRLSKGYGFLVINLSVTELSFTEVDHYFDNRKISVRRYMKGKELEENVQSILSKRLFIKRIPENIKDKDIEDYFQQFGTISMVYLTQNYAVKQMKSLIGFVHFEDESSINKVLVSEIHYIKTVAVKCSIYDPSKNKPIATNSGPTTKRNKKTNKKEKESFLVDHKPTTQIPDCKSNGQESLNHSNKISQLNRVNNPTYNLKINPFNLASAGYSNEYESLPLQVSQVNSNYDGWNTQEKRSGSLMEYKKSSFERYTSNREKKEQKWSRELDHSFENLRFNIELPFKASPNPRSNETSGFSKFNKKVNLSPFIRCLINETTPAQI